MASVYLLSVASESPSKWDHALDDLARLERAADKDRFGVHGTTDDPEAADIILFVENCNTITHFFEVVQHPVYRAHSEKCYLFTRNDIVVPFLPGVYASIPRRWYDPVRTRPGFYLDIYDKGFITYDAAEVPRDYLYSFIGQMTTHPIREAIADLSHPSQYIRDTSDFWPYGKLDNDTQQRLEDQYVDVARRSRFVLCPRGRGVSSIRLFEMMKMGRAPVVISDEWVPPEGPEWDQFSLRVDEGDIEHLPNILEKHADEAIHMGKKARDAWKTWFSPQSCFHWVTEWCLELESAQSRSSWHTTQNITRQLTQPAYLRHLLRSATKHLSPLRT